MINYTNIAEEAARDRYCHQHPDELVVLLKLLNKLQPKIYMEIGTYYAGGMWAVSKVIPNSLLIGVDNHSLDTRITSSAWVKKQGIKSKVKIFDLDSQDEATLDTVQKYLGDQQVDFLFIDGNHYYDYVARDFELYRGLVKKGGYIGFHDINPPDANKNVRDLWAEIKDGYTFQEILLAPGWGGVGIITQS